MLCLPLCLYSAVIISQVTNMGRNSLYTLFESFHSGIYEVGKREKKTFFFVIFDWEIILSLAAQQRNVAVRIDVLILIPPSG